MTSLTNMQDLRTVLGQLNPERPAGPGSRDGETRYQQRSGSLIKRLELEVESRQGKARVLVSGQIGVGKSSELWQFFRRQREKKQSDGYWVHCDLEHDEHPERCGANGVLLTILRDCWGATRQLREDYGGDPRIRSNFVSLRDKILEKLIDWLKGVRSSNGADVVFRFGGMDFPIHLRDKDRALALILGKAAQHEAVSKREDRFGLASDSLIHLINDLSGWIKTICRRPPVLIIDHVDKIRDEASAREVLVEIIPQWQRIDASIIMTAPFEYTIGDMRSSVESYWRTPLIVHPLPIPELDDINVPDIYQKIIKGSQLGGLISPEGLKLLSHYCGGIPRTFVQFIIDAAKKAYLSDLPKINEDIAYAVVYEAQRAYQDYGYEQLALLDSIARTGTGLGSAMTLLRSPIGLLVMEPDKGKHQVLRPHPLAENVLERYRMQTGKVTI